MLAHLSIRDIVLIDRLDIDLGPGMTVLTGETGAGKSILLDAFALALGGRGDGALVREGQRQGQVTAAFAVAPDHRARLLAEELELDASEGDLILRRVQMADGRTRAFVNDQPVSAQVMRTIGRSLVEIHGQHDDRAMVEQGTHRNLLDAFGGLETGVAAVRGAHAQLRSLEEQYRAEEERLAALRSETDFLRHAQAELESLASEAGEEERLAERRHALQAAEKVVGDLRDALDAITADALVAGLNGAARRLGRRQTQAPELVGESVAAIDAALVAFDQAREALEGAIATAEFEPSELEKLEERLFALRAAARKFGVPPDELSRLATTYSSKLEAIDADEVRLASLRVAKADAEVAYRAAAETLSAERKRVAAALDEAVGAELAPLKLENAKFRTHVEQDEPSATGVDAVSFWISTNPGTRPGPLMKIASGGELARFMLALKVALAGRVSVSTLVFDEIDTGVGGATADAMGQRLARLAEGAQVLAVTHAPQVAARASQHLRIAKAIVQQGAAVATTVTPLGPDPRREEIARMLAGATITAEARAAAGRLLAKSA